MDSNEITIDELDEAVLDLGSESSKSTKTEKEKYSERMKKRKELQEERLKRREKEKGLVLVFTGNGKGKTTAALGLLIRTIGHGEKAAMTLPAIIFSKSLLNREFQSTRRGILKHSWPLYHPTNT